MYDYLLSLDALRKAGLTPDWQTVYIGWRAPLSEEYDWRIKPLSVEAVQQYAAECLTGDPDTDYPLVRLLYAGSTSQELEREEDYLRELAARSGVDEEAARRKWRYVDALRVPLEMPRRPRAEESEYEVIWEWESTVSDFLYTWRNAELNHPLPDWNLDGDIKAAAALLRSWLAEEKAALDGCI